MGNATWHVPQIEEKIELFSSEHLKCTTNDEIANKYYNMLCQDDQDTIRDHFIRAQKCDIQNCSGFKFVGKEGKTIYLVYSVYPFQENDNLPRPEGRPIKMKVTQLNMK